MKDVRYFGKYEVVAKYIPGMSYQVVPENMQNQKQGHQKVEDIVDREHLD